MSKVLDALNDSKMEKKSKFRPNLKIFGVVPEDPGWIYVIKNRELYKIGKSSNPVRRILRDAKTWLPDLDVIGIKPFWNVTEVERHLHEGLTNFWHDREWFKFGDDPFKKEFIESFQEFYDEDHDMNSVDFIYWYNGSGMAEFAMERHYQNVSLRKWLRKNRSDSETDKLVAKKHRIPTLSASDESDV